MKAIYAFSGDPITYGHIDIIERASKIFDELIVAIGVNPDKKYTFSLEDRLDMAKESLFKLVNVKVISFTGLLVDFAYENNISIIIRGIRNSTDLDYEYQMHTANMTQRDIETIPIFARPELSHISSSIVKSIVKEQGRVEAYVPLYVKERLEKTLLDQKILCVTGAPATGKSFLCNRLVEIGRKNGEEVHNIDLDTIAHDILEVLKEEAYIMIRNNLANHFGEDILDENGMVKRKVLGEKVFGEEEELSYLNTVMHPAIYERMRKVMYGLKGLILINAALLAESDFLTISNNHVVLVTASLEKQRKRMQQRGLTDKQVENRIKSQYDFSRKKELIETAIEDKQYGRLWVLDTTDEDPLQIEQLFNEININL